MKKSSKADRAIRVQYGALPYRFTKEGALEILLMTTRQSKRWIIPKGGPIKGLKPPKSAAREAFEEAGIRGTVAGRAAGSYRFEKTLTEGGIVPCEVRVFPLLVKRQHRTWPEARERTSRWFEPERAIAALKDEGLQEIIVAFWTKTTAHPKHKTRMRA